MEYWLLEWSLPEPIEYNNNDDDGATEMKSKQDFYSILVHLPESQVLYEFISDKLDLSLLSENDVLMKSEMRATFSRYCPFCEEDMHDVDGMVVDDDEDINEADVVIPLRLSRGVSDLEETLTWYENVMQASILYKTDDFVVADMNGDNSLVKYGFVLNVDTKIEIGFYQRENDYTNGDYTIKDFETDLNSVHSDIVKSEVCGLDRWFDNHCMYYKPFYFWIFFESFFFFANYFFL